MPGKVSRSTRSEEHTSELESPCNMVCRLLLEKKKKKYYPPLVPSTQPHVSHPLTRVGGCRLGGQKVVLTGVNLYSNCYVRYVFFFFNDTATTEIYTLSLHDALPI